MSISRADGVALTFAGQLDQLVGLVAAGADDHHDLVAGPLGRHGPRGRRPNLRRIRDARPAEFLNDQRHGVSTTSGNKQSIAIGSHSQKE